MIFHFSWRTWLDPALAGAQLSEKVMSLSSAGASHHHLRGKNWDPFKQPAVNHSADCSLSQFSQMHQVHLQHLLEQSALAVLILPRELPAPAPFTALTLPSYQKISTSSFATLTGGLFSVCFFFPKYQYFHNLGYVIQVKKERNWPPTKNKERRMTFG